MKNSSIFASAAMILATAAIASANPFSDVPASHWAYQSVNAMAEKGLIQGFPNGTFKGNQNVTRYQLAMMTARMIASIEGTGVKGIAKTDLQTLEKLTVEFADELALLGVKVTALEDDMQVVKEDVAGLKKDVASLKSCGGSKIKFSGDMFIRNYGMKDTDKTIPGAKVVDKSHRTETMLRLQMDAKIDENVTARARWNIVENNIAGDNHWTGDNKKTGSVEIAYIQIKDMFKFGGDFKFGRDWFSHGHKFVMHDYADAVSYTKRCGKFDVAANIFFLDDINAINSTSDRRQMWNLNADYAYKSHKMYVGFYYASVAKNAPAVGGVDSKLKKNEKLTVIELGSSGKLGHNEKFSYDLAGVYSKAKEADLKGWLGHAAVKYDTKKQLKAQLAYTMATDKYTGNLKVDNNNRWCDGEVTPLEDFALFTMVSGSNSNFNVDNLKGIKAELGYTLKNHDKHSFRLAYDHVRMNDKNKEAPTAFADITNPFYAAAAVDNKVNDVKCNLITFEYTYKLAANTRLRFGYQHTTLKSTAKNNGGDLINDKTNLYYTEIYSRF